MKPFRAVTDVSEGPPGVRSWPGHWESVGGPVRSALLPPGS